MNDIRKFWLTVLIIINIVIMGACFESHKNFMVYVIILVFDMFLCYPARLKTLEKMKQKK